MAQLDGSWHRQMLRRRGIDDRAWRAADNAEQQRRRSFHGRELQTVIHPSLEPLGRIGLQTVPARGPGNRARREECAFQEHVGRACGNAAALAAHHAGDCDRPIAVGNQQRFGVERRLSTVEQQQRLAVAGATYDHRIFQYREVERVHRLTEFQHHVVGNVDHGIDRAQPRAPQSFFHPCRRLRARIHAANDAAEITRATRAVLETHRKRICRRSRRPGHSPPARRASETTHRLPARCREGSDSRRDWGSTRCLC